jgi:hypothetical protein
MVAVIEQTLWRYRGCSRRSCAACGR